MIVKRYRKQSLLLFIASLLSVIFMAVSFWEIIINSKLPTNKLNIWPLLLLFSSIFLITGLFLFYFKATNNQVITDAINSKVEEERGKIISEFSKRDNAGETTDEELDVENKLSQLLPKGNFKNYDSYLQKLLASIANEFELVQGMAFIKDQKKSSYQFATGYALTTSENIPGFKEGENITGQSALDKEIILINDIPDEYFAVESGLGKSKPKHLLAVPFVKDENVVAIMELGTFREPTPNDISLLKKISEHAADKLIQLQKS